MTTRTCAVCGCLLAHGNPTPVCDDCRDDFGPLDNLDGRDESDDDLITGPEPDALAELDFDPDATSLDADFDDAPDLCADHEAA